MRRCRLAGNRRGNRFDRFVRRRVRCASEYHESSQEQNHGGNGKSHGQTTVDEITIPWVLCGPSVKAGFEISDTVNTYDTAATLAYIFGAKAPQCWIGRPVQSAFK